MSVRNLRRPVNQNSSSYFWALLAQDAQSDIAGLPFEQFTQTLRGRISREDAFRMEAQAEDWRRNHPFSGKGLYFVKLSTGPSYIEASAAVASPN